MKKYLLYAIGEILLVIIGILIALQINTWNENRKDRKQERYLLNQILKDIQQDSTLLAYDVRLTEAKAGQGNRIKEAVVRKEYDLQIDTLAVSSFLIGKPVLFEAYTPTFDELISSGKLNIIKNEHIKSLLKNYKNKNSGYNRFIYEESLKRKQDYNAHMHQYFEPQIMTYLWKSVIKDQVSLDTLRTYHMDVKGFIDDPNTLYHVNNVIGTDLELSWFYKERTAKTISNISKELREVLKRHHD
jgi:hypothetical protein